MTALPAPLTTICIHGIRLSASSCYKCFVAVGNGVRMVCTTRGNTIWTYTIPARAPRTVAEEFDEAAAQNAQRKSRKKAVRDVFKPWQRRPR